MALLGDGNIPNISYVVSWTSFACVGKEWKAVTLHKFFSDKHEAGMFKRNMHNAMYALKINADEGLHTLTHYSEVDLSDIHEVSEVTVTQKVQLLLDAAEKLSNDKNRIQNPKTK